MSATSPDPKGDLSRIGGPTRPAWGTGPAYPTNHPPGATGGPMLEYEDPISQTSGFHGSRWSGNKVYWYVDGAAYAGPLLIRGRQLDGMNLLRFDVGLDPEIRVLESYRGYGSFTRVHVGAGGCYTYQIDGTSFTSLIVFEAVPHPPT